MLQNNTYTDTYTKQIKYMIIIQYITRKIEDKYKSHKKYSCRHIILMYKIV